jgi:excisionase family DNA binding protein
MQHDTTKPPGESGGCRSSSAPILWSKAELAHYLDLSTRTIDRLAASGMLPAPTLMLGSRKRWSREVIDRWLSTRPKITTRSASERRGGR